MKTRATVFVMVLLPVTLLLMTPNRPVYADAVEGTLVAPPDAGQILRELSSQRLSLPAFSPEFRIEADAPTDASPGGQRVVINDIHFTGNQLLDDATLLNVVTPFDTEPLDFSGIVKLVNRITQAYRDQGYTFARAYLPEQDVSGGLLRIEILEGRLGEVAVTPRPEILRFGPSAQRFTQALRPGEVIIGEDLERVALIMDRQPGFEVIPVVRPGTGAGTGDLEFLILPTGQGTVQATYDNHGSRASGAQRVILDVVNFRNRVFGDRFTLRASYTEEDTWMGSMAYRWPVGGIGWSSEVSINHTEYQLGGDFRGFNGSASVYRVGWEYPILATQLKNIDFSMALQHKDFINRNPDGRESKNSQSLPLSLRMDLRDGFWGGGLSFGILGVTLGQMNLSGEAAGVEGSFARVNLDLVRYQQLPLGIIGQLRGSAQWSAQALDSSEGFGIGGPSGVRGYPQGEANGDLGASLQVDLRKALPQQEDTSLYVFHDLGRIRSKIEPFTDRSLTGYGVGLNSRHGRFSMDLSVARRLRGGPPVADTRNLDQQFWVTLGYRFR